MRLAAHEWRDERGMTWLETARKIKLFPVTDARKPHSLSVAEQEILFGELPKHLLRMALYKVNAGNREEEVCSLRWAWERKVPELETRFSSFRVTGLKTRRIERLPPSAAKPKRRLAPKPPKVRVPRRVLLFALLSAACRPEFCAECVQIRARAQCAQFPCAASIRLPAVLTAVPTPLA